MNSVKVRCYRCGMVEFTVPVGTHPSSVICNGCYAQIKQQQRLPDYNIPIHGDEPYWVE